MWPSIGTHLADKLPGEVYSIWMLCDHGRHGQVVLAEPGEELRSNPLAMEHLLAKAGAMFFLPLHSNDPRRSYLDQQRNFLQNGQLASGVVTQQADAIFFVADVSEFRQR